MLDPLRPAMRDGLVSNIAPPAAAAFTPPAAAGLPVGAIVWTLGTGLVGEEWLDLDGSDPLTDSYPELAAVVGVRYEDAFGEAGPGRFRLPNMRGRMVVTPDAVTLFTGAIGGEAAHTLITAEMPSHGHSLRSPNAPSDAAYYDFVGGGAGTRTILRPNTSGVAGVAGEWSATATGDGDAHNNMPPYLVVAAQVRALP